MESILDENLLKNENFNGACLACGQAGYKMMMKFAVATGVDPEKCFCINTAKADLKKASFVPQSNRLLIAPDGEGAGMDNELVYGMIAQTNGDVLKLMNEKLKGDFNWFFVFYSADGGTGSGSGPTMTALCSSSKNLERKGGVTPVVGICALPDHFAGDKALENTITNLNQTRKLLKLNAARIMFVDNDVYSGIKDIATRWQTANDDMAELLKRYIMFNYLSDERNLDFADRRVAMDLPGQHALVKFKPNGEFTSPFVLPEGVSVRKIASELPKGCEEGFEKMKDAIGCSSSSDDFKGLYEEGVEGAYPIAHFAGFYNVEKLATKYRNWLEQINQKSAAQEKIDIEAGRAFNNVSSIINERKEKSSVKEIDSFTDIFSALAED